MLFNTKTLINTNRYIIFYYMVERLKASFSSWEWGGLGENDLGEGVYASTFQLFGNSAI